MKISKRSARRFMLKHHYLLPPRNLSGNEGILTYIKQIGCIQFDPINIVGRNPDLVLQGRVANYKPSLLEKLLYSTRELVDGWDKMASIFRSEDWSYFHFQRERNKRGHSKGIPEKSIIQEVLKEIRDHGPLSSLDFNRTEKVDWYWGPTNIARAALEYLFAKGSIGVHHRVNNRRVFDVIENLLPEKIIDTIPFETIEEYQTWHILRRISSLGLADSRSGEYWYGIVDTRKKKERNKIITELLIQDKIINIDIEGLKDRIFYIRKRDLDIFQNINNDNPIASKAAIIAPLDNLIWNRKIISELFDFNYIWEVYKPKNQRKFGYYVLPVLYKDKFIARFEPGFDKIEGIFYIKQWWWEENADFTAEIEMALIDCFTNFLKYLGAKSFNVGISIDQDDRLAWLRNIQIEESLEF